MAQGLRERRRHTAMRTIRECALDLFDERGFATVTIEEIAATAEVSPSSVYRYFGTKEGLVVVDEFDALNDDAVRDLFDTNDPVGSLVRLVVGYESGSEEIPRRRVRYFFREPSVRAAVLVSLDRAAQRIAPLLTGDGGLTATQARVAANALVFGYLGALEQWYLDDGAHPIAHYVDEGTRPLRAVFAAGG